MRKLCFLVVLALSLAGPALAGGPKVPVAPAPAVAPVPAIPEPAALALFVLGVSVVGVAIRRRKA